MSGTNSYYFDTNTAPQPSPSSTLPESYDVRDAWGTTCPSVRHIRDQGGCGSCWAVRKIKQTIFI